MVVVFSFISIHIRLVGFGVAAWSVLGYEIWQSLKLTAKAAENGGWEAKGSRYVYVLGCPWKLVLQLISKLVFIL